jgi:hypothetical protein
MRPDYTLHVAVQAGLLGLSLFSCTLMRNIVYKCSRTFSGERKERGIIYADNVRTDNKETALR